MYAIRSYYDYSGRRIDTGKWPAANLIFSPRIGFVWDTFGDKSLKVRGGTGLFSGRITSYNVCYTKLLRAILTLNSGNMTR